MALARHRVAIKEMSDVTNREGFTEIIVAGILPQSIYSHWKKKYRNQKMNLAFQRVPSKGERFRIFSE